MIQIPNGETRLFLILGDPIAQVKSPTGLTKIMAARGANALVAPAHVSAEDAPAMFEALRRLRNLDGLLATVPHKFAALEACDAVSDRAAFVGSVNVMRRRADGGFVGDNLDGVGFLEGLKREGFGIEAKRALLVGAGGAGSAIAFEMLERGAASLAIHDVETGRRDRLVARLAERYPGRVETGGTDPTGFDLAANATPAGMREDDALPIESHRMAPPQFAADVITKPAISPMLEQARSRGCAIMPGAGMFEAQAELLVDYMLDETPGGK